MSPALAVSPQEIPSHLSASLYQCTERDGPYPNPCGKHIGDIENVSSERRTSEKWKDLIVIDVDFVSERPVHVTFGIVGQVVVNVGNKSIRFICRGCITFLSTLEPEQTA